MRLLVLGPMAGYRSYPVVMRGLAGAFESLGIDVVRGDVMGLYSSLTSADLRAVSLGVNPGLDVDGVFAMKPSAQMLKIDLPLVGMHVGDVSEIPEDWKLAIRAERFAVAPSSWMADVIREEVGTGCPEVVVANHGVEQEYLDAGPGEAPSGPFFSFLHFCSAGVYPERKGTPQVLSAFQSLAMENRKVGLTLVISEKRRPFKKLLGRLEPRIRDRVHVRVNPSGFSPREMIQVYRGHHVLLAPSRAEGFGICVASGTAVTCRGGVKSVEHVGVGEEVLGHDGGWHRVAATKSREVRGVVRVKAQGVPDILATQEHPFLVVHRRKGEKFRKFQDRVGEPDLSWKNAAALEKGDYLVLGAPRFAGEVRKPVLGFERYAVGEPLRKGDFFTSRYSNRRGKGPSAQEVADNIGVSIHVFRRAVQDGSTPLRQDTKKRYSLIREKADELGYFSQKVWFPRTKEVDRGWCHLLGYYASEGSLFSQGGGVSFAFNGAKDKVAIEQTVEALQGLGLRGVVRKKKRSQGVEVLCTSSVLARALLASCGGGSPQKRLPPYVWELSGDFRRSVLEALVRGDGWNADGAVCFGTTSRVLGFQVRDLWLSIGIPAGIRRTSGTDCRDSWRVRVTGSHVGRAREMLGLLPRGSRKTSRRSSQFVRLGGVWLTPVRGISVGKSSHDVFDLRVEGAETFVAEGVVVHNCPLEARALGIPVIKTRATGFRDHDDGAGVLVVPTGPLAPAWGGMGQAPTLGAQDVYEAMKTATETYDDLVEAACDGASSMSRWSWKSTTAGLADKLKEGTWTR